MSYKRKLTFKLISTFLIFLHIYVFCLKDAAVVFAETATVDSTDITADYADASSDYADATSSITQDSQAIGSSEATPVEDDSSQEQDRSKQEVSKIAATSSDTYLEKSNPTNFNLSALQNLQPSLFTGALTYSVPIAVPAGRKGIQPNIALAYSSQSGNDILGMGWSLDLGSIERSTKRGAPKYDSTDTFIFKSGGSAVELVNIGGYEYRAKTEEAFMKFQNNGTSGWVVTDKSGIKYYFGQNSSSQQTDGSRIFKWCLDKVKDTLGNYMTLTYIKDNYQIYPDTIDYTGYSGTPALSPTFQVDFDYLDSRADYFFSYRSNFKIQTNKLLSTIIAKQNGSRIRKYVLNFTQSPSTKKNLLTSITEYGLTDSSYLPPIAFTYQEKPKRVDSSSNWSNVAYSSESEGSAIRVTSSPTFLDNFDINGDGLADRIISGYKFGDLSRWEIQFNDGQQFLNSVYWGGIFYNSGGSYQSQWGAVRWHSGSSTYHDVIDINGDGLIDRVFQQGRHLSSWNKWHVQLNTGSSFNSISEWGGIIAYNEQIWSCLKEIDNGQTTVDIFDINGDGLPDRIMQSGYKTSDYSKWEIQINNGQGFEPKQFWGGIFYDSDERWGAIRWHSGSRTYVDIIDMNGDGLPDRVLQYGNRSGDYSKWKVQFNNGIGFDSPVDWGGTIAYCDDSDKDWASIRAFNSNIYVDIFDINGDGLSDRVLRKHDSLYDYWEVQLNNGVGFDELIQWTGIANASMSDWASISASDSTIYVAIADINGDGLVDRVMRGDHNGSGRTAWEVQINTPGFPNLLSTISNGIGGSAQVEYKAYKGADNTDGYDQCKLPFPVQTVKRITTSDGRGSSYHSDYSYDKGEFDFTEREFRGFGKVKVTDVDGNYSVSYFHQGDKVKDPQGHLKGRQYKQETFDSSGKQYSKSENTWNIQSDIYPGYPDIKFAYLSESHTYIYDVNGDLAKRTKAGYSYDNYGNPIQVIEYAEVDLDGNDIGSDKRITETQYTYDATDWILGLPSNVKVFDIDNNKVSEKNFYYDGSTSLTTPPAEGLLTKEEAWLYNPVDSSQKIVDSKYAYNSYGNLTSATDANGHTTTTTYDSTYKIFPLTVTNHLGHTVTSEYYGVNSVPLDDGKYRGLFGQVKSQQDPNGVKSYNIYDNLGRSTKTIGPNDSLDYPAVIYDYDIVVTDPLTDPVKITKKVKAKDSPASQDYPDYYISYAFYDGLGRQILAKSPAEDDPATGLPRQIVSGIVEYNNRGLVEKKYFPYFVEANPDFVSPDYNKPSAIFQYDCLGRVLQTTNPDSTYSSTSYNDWQVISTDEEGNYHTYYYDAYQRLIQVDEHNDGATYTTTYEYDILGNLTKVRDDAGNETNITYDSLGRKIQMQDPDMGVWKYYYDNVGNLTKQIDAAAQELVFEYDAINRLTKKTIQATQTVTYEYDDLTKDYCKGRLSKVTYEAGSAEFFYDNLGREIKSIKTVDSEQWTVCRTYDSLDRLVTLTYPDGEVVIYTYNPQGIETVKGVSVIDSATKLLLHSDGPDGSTSFTDSSSLGYPVAAHGNAQIDTQESKFGGSSVLFDGDGDCLTLADSDDWNFGTENFTIDFWARFNAVSGDHFFFDIGKEGEVTGINFEYWYGHGLFLHLNANGYLFDFTPSMNNWYHMAITRNGTDLRVFVDGKQVGTTQTDNTNINAGTYGMAIGATNVLYFYGFNGRIDELRISKGTARWTEDFSPPEESYSFVEQYYVTNIDYSPTGQVIKQQYGNGTETNYAYDPKTLRLNQLQTTNNQQQTIQDLEYTFDNVGNVRTITDAINTGTQYFEYDNLNRLTYADGASYGAIDYVYDSIGNITKKGNLTLNYQDSRPHAVSSYTDGSQTVTFDYDANGNMSNRTNQQTNELTNYYYDYEGHLTEVEQVYETGRQVQATLQLEPNWNFFSLPVNPTTSDIAEIFSRSIYNPAQEPETKLLLHSDGPDESINFTDSSSSQHYITAHGNAQIDTQESKFGGSSALFTIGEGIDSYTKLALHCNGPDGSTSFTDSSSLGYPVAAHGNAQIDTQESKFGGSSALFDGEGDYLILADSADWNFGTDDFAIDCWVRFNDLPDSGLSTILHQDGGGIGEIYLIWDCDNNRWSMGAQIIEGSGTAIHVQDSITTVDTWYHIAWVRNGDNFYFFRNGVLKGSDTKTGTLVNPTNPLSIGCYSTIAPGHYFNGRIDEFRISKGIARWTEDFSPPNAEYTLREDSSYLSISDSDDWNFGTEDWTIDFWVRFNSLRGISQTIYCQYADTRNRIWLWQAMDQNSLRFIFYDDGAPYSIYRDFTPIVNNWYHIAVTRNGDTFRLFVNGSQLGEAATLTGSIPDITAEVRIGVDQNIDYPFDGWIDEFRVSKGIARWTQDFTPPAPEINNNQISRYKPDTDSFENYVSNPTFDDFNSLEYGKGYAIFVDNPSGISVNVVGTTPEAQDITLSEGWNLIPYPYLSKRSIQEGLGNLKVGVDYDLVKSYNTSTEATDKFETFPGSLTDLRPNKSYYIHCLKDTAWSLEPLSRTTKFYYDGDGGRVKRVSEIDQGETTVYIGSLYEKVTTDEGTETTKKHIYAGANRICTVNGTQSTVNAAFYHSDHLGSSNVITNNTGEQVALYEYSPFGEVSRQTGSYDTDVRYTGKIQDDTGLYYYGARYYDPVIGRFITPDSIVQAPYDPQSLNRYSYCRNNPINLVDPTGHWFWALVWAVIQGAFAGAAVGAGLAAITGGNIGQGALLGAITGAFFSGTSFLGEGLKGGMKILARAATGASSGVAGAAAIGVDPGRGAWLGAVSGVAFGAISDLGGKSWKWDLGRVALGGTAGGAISELAGGDFLDGFIFAGTIAGADFVYRSILSAQGRHGASMKTAEKKGQPKLDVDGKPLIGKDGKAIVLQDDLDANHVGTRSRSEYKDSWEEFKNEFTGETGTVMDTLGRRVPGFQGLSLVHDPLGNFIETTFGQTAWGILNIPTMAPIYGLNLVGSAINDNPTYIGLHKTLREE